MVRVVSLTRVSQKKPVLAHKHWFLIPTVFFLQSNGQSSVMDRAPKTREIVTTVFEIPRYVKKGGSI